MDYQSVLAIIFVILLSLLLYLKRNKLIVQYALYPIIYFVMYRTKLGIKWMDEGAARFGKSIRLVSVIGIVVGFIGMLFISYELVANTITLFTQPDAAPSIKPVMPFAAKGVFFVPFLYWIISIFVIAIVHEFCHGLVARAYDIPVQSSGFAFLGIIAPLIPAAFVEPNERKMSKHPARDQLAVFSAGPFANILTAGLLFIFAALVINPAAHTLLDLTGVKAATITAGGPAAGAAVQEGELITAIDNVQIKTVEDFTRTLARHFPRDTVILTTNVTKHAVSLRPHPNNATKPFIGIAITQATEVNKAFKQKYGEIPTSFIIWFFGLIYWLLLLNLGVGLFNLLPLGPVDGGRMLLLALQKVHPKKGRLAWKIIGFFFLALILVNIVAGFIK